VVLASVALVDPKKK
jgi:hypothetical protein